MSWLILRSVSGNRSVWAETLGPKKYLQSFKSVSDYYFRFECILKSLMLTRDLVIVLTINFDCLLIILSYKVNISEVLLQGCCITNDLVTYQRDLAKDFTYFSESCLYVCFPASYVRSLLKDVTSRSYKCWQVLMNIFIWGSWFVGIVLKNFYLFRTWRYRCLISY